MRSLLLQPWTTIIGNASLNASGTTTIIQDVEGWADVGGAQDAAIWIDVRNVAVATTGGTNVYLTFDSSPTRDEGCFSPATPTIALGASPATTVTKTVRGVSATGLARYLRWRLTADGTGGPFQATFRVRASLSRTAYFVPTQLPSCVLWLRADLGVVQSTLAVSSWADQSGVGNDLSQATNQPTYVASAINGLPGITAAGGTAQCLDRTSLVSSIGSPCTAYVVAQGGDNTANRAFIDNPSGTRMVLYGQITNGLERFYVNGTDNIGTKLVASPHVYCAAPNVDGANDLLYVDSIATADITRARGTPASLTSFRVGNDNAAASASGGPVCEVIVYNGAHTTAQRTAVMQYLASRYGITLI